MKTTIKEILENHKAYSEKLELALLRHFNEARLEVLKNKQTSQQVPNTAQADHSNRSKPTAPTADQAHLAMPYGIFSELVWFEDILKEYFPKQFTRDFNRGLSLYIINSQSMDISGRVNYGVGTTTTLMGIAVLMAASMRKNVIFLSKSVESADFREFSTPSLQVECNSNAITCTNRYDHTNGMIIIHKNYECLAAQHDVCCIINDCDSEADKLHKDIRSYLLDGNIKLIEIIGQEQPCNPGDPK